MLMLKIIWWCSLSEVIDGLINWPHLLPFLLPLHVVWLGDSCGQARLNEASFAKGGEKPRAVASRKFFRLNRSDVSSLAFTDIIPFKSWLRCLLQSALALYWCGSQWNNRGTCWIFWSKLGQGTGNTAGGVKKKRKRLGISELGMPATLDTWHLFIALPSLQCVFSLRQCIQHVHTMTMH